jgi:hypothetical protein
MDTVNIPDRLKEKLKSFDEWSKAGYRIKKGSKAVARRASDGKYLFTDKQVYKPSYDGNWDDYENEMCFDGDPWGLNS